MNNPFESGHIKNYILLYSSIVLIMVLFFIASSLFNEVKDVNKKIFQKGNIEILKTRRMEKKKPSPHFKLMDKVY